MKRQSKSRPLGTIICLCAAALLAAGCGMFGDAKCKSKYDGTYIGQFDAEWTDLLGDPVGSGGFNVTLVFECTGRTSDTVSLAVKHVIVDHAYFGCGVGGCTPTKGFSWANLPADTPTSPSNPSLTGHGVQVYFENGSGIETIREPGYLTVSGDGRTLSNAPLCGQEPSGCWMPAAADGSGNFPGGDYMPRGVSWTLTKSAL